jgi:DNA-binding response OmpR family regulator
MSIEPRLPATAVANKIIEKGFSRIRIFTMARILCVDDELHAAKLKCIILETAGHTATPATSAREAISLLESQPYDLIVTDWRLGEASGRDILVAARKISGAPVVVISGYVNEAFQAADPLADYYLEKPVNPEELISVVADLVNQSAHNK